MRKTALALTLALLGSASAQAAGFSLNFLGEQQIATGTLFQGSTVGGLSGIDYDAASGRYFAISDDRSQFNPARFYTLDLDYSASGFNGVTVTGVTTLQRADGTSYPALSVDPESLRLQQGANGTQIVWTSEGDANALIAPSVNVANLDGSYVGQYSVPSYYAPVAGNTSGIRNNLAFESLTVNPDGGVIVATENALVQDGPAASVSSGSASRILSFAADGSVAGEFIYNVDAVAAAPIPDGSFATNGLVELLALDATRAIAVERSFSTGVGNSIKLYLADWSEATDVSGLASVAGSDYTAASKSLLLDLGTLGITLDNIEGITFGASLENGNPVLVLVSDNNFAGNQVTQFLAFEVSAVPEPQSWALLLTGLAGVVHAVRRRRAA